MELREKTAVNVGWTAMSQALTVGLYQLVLLILASILTPRDFGIYAACTVVNSILVQTTTLGLDYAVINSRSDWMKVVSCGSFLRIIVSIVGLGIIIAISGQLSDLFQIDDLETPIILIASASVILALAFPSQMELTKRLHFVRLSITRMCGSVTWSVVALTMAIMHYGYWSPVIALVASQFAILLSAYILSPPRIQLGLDRTVARNLLGFGGITAFGFLLAMIAANVDRFIVGFVIGPEALGIYWAAFTYGTLAPTWLTGIINAVMYPTYAVLRKNPTSLRLAYTETLRYTSEFASPVSMCLAGGSSIFILTLLGEDWQNGVECLSLLAVAGFFVSLTSPAGSLFISLGRPELVYRITIVFLAPMIPLAILAAYSFGILGVSAVILGHEAVKCVYVVWRAERLTEARSGIVLRQIVPSLTAGMVAGVCVFVLSTLLAPSVWSLFFTVGAGVLIYFSIGIPLSNGKLLSDIKEGLRILRVKSPLKSESDFKPQNP